MSEAASATPAFAAIEALYKRHRYLDAFELSRPAWNVSTDVETLTVEQLILGCRLAVRLGGARVSRWLLRKAYEREPENPQVKYYSRHFRQRRENFFDRFRGDAQKVDLGSNNPELDAAWLTYLALTWAALRDFERASQCISKAHSISPNDPWVSSCESISLGVQDRWPEALDAAELSWKGDPGAFYAGTTLASSLLALGRIEEAADRLLAVSEVCQSFELVFQAIWYQCALAETMDHADRGQPLECALRLAQRLPGLVPLRDRETQAQIALMHLQIAALRNDHQEIGKWAKEARAPFYRRILENLRTNPQGRSIHLPFQRSKQKFQTCLPASLAAAVAVMGRPIDPAVMAAEITHGGTSYWSATDWLARRGLETRFFPVTAQTGAALIRSGIPFILGLESEDFSHAVAVVGLDEAKGTLLFHDPNGFRLCEYLLDSIGRGEAPLGPRGMVVFPPERAAEVDRILPRADSEALAAHAAYQKAMTAEGLAAAGRVVDEVIAKHPDHPSARFLQASYWCEEGRGNEGVRILRELVALYPNSGALRSSLLAACRSLGNSALLRETLAEVVESRTLPGVQSQQMWRYPPAAYVCNYADVLRSSASTRREARRLLNSALQRQPGYADTWRVLADCLSHEGDQEGRLMALRIASCLGPANEYYARAYCDALASANRRDEGLAWLEARTRQFHGTPGESSAWTTWIGALEYWGQPDQALVAAGAARRSCGGSPGLLSFLVPFFARMGSWDEAGQCLKKLESQSSRALFHSACTDYFDLRGEIGEALNHAEAWITGAPRFLQARSRYLDLLGRREGSAAAARVSAHWVSQFPGHDGFERLYCGIAESPENPSWKKDRLLYRRVKRNPEDGWAWRELLFRRLRDYTVADDSRQKRLRPGILELLRECERTAPEDPSTLRGHAQWSEAQGNWFEAVAAWRKAIEAEPASLYSYRRFWECCATFEIAEQRKLFLQIEPMFLSYPGRLSMAMEFAFLLAHRFGPGFAEERVMYWMEQRPEDPEVIQAAAELLLRYGLGLSDATRALAMLEPAVGRFPYHLGLRFAFANTQLRTGKHDDSMKTLMELAHRHPGNIRASIQLARVLEQSGKSEEAQQLMRSAESRNPLSPEIWDLRVQVLTRSKRFGEARKVIAEGLERLTDGVWWREKAVRMLLDCGDADGAIELAREGVRLYPRGAYLWRLLAGVLRSTPQRAQPGEEEACLRRSLQLNASYFDAADLLSTLLVQHRHFDEAEHVLLAIMPRLSDPSSAKGRLAWVYRQRGNSREAVEEMAAVLQQSPWYRWGWSVLMEWLVEDKSWERAKSLLESCPSVLRNDLQIRRQRLMVLEKAHVPAARTEQEWNDLLRDFPREVPLQLQRYDSLRSQERFPESAELLRAAVALDPRNPFLQARQVETFVDEGKRTEALELLLAIWFAEVETSPWPADYSWKAVQQKKFEEEAYSGARQRMDKGSRPTPRAVALMAAHLMKGETWSARRRPVWSEWFLPRNVRELLAVLERMDKIAGERGAHRGELLGYLSRSKYYLTIVRYWRKNKALANQDVGLWGTAGSALISVGRKAEARKLLSGWRQRQGVKMWMVANYIFANPKARRKDMMNVASACQDALQGLQHDHTAKYLAHTLAEMQILLRNHEGFRQTMSKYRSLFSGYKQEKEYFPVGNHYLLTEIPRMEKLLEQNQMRKFRWARLKLLLNEAGMKRLWFTRVMGS